MHRKPGENRGGGETALAILATILLLSALVADLPSLMPRAAEEEGESLNAEELRRLLDLLEKLDPDQLRELMEKIEELEARLQALEGESEDEDLAEILAEAEELTAGEKAREEDTEAERKSFTGRQRSQQALNPEISFLGDFSYDYTRGDLKDGFLVRGVELSFQAALDPYTRFKGHLAGHQEPFELELHEEEPVEQEHGHDHGESEIGVNVEEAYMEWVALPGNTRLRVGKFRQQYGTLNRWHRHALPTVDSPRALQNVFGHEGLVGLGVGLDWQLPGLWATSNGLTVEVVNADNPAAFAGSRWNDPSFLLRHTGFFEFNPDTWLEVGLNSARGPNDGEGVFDTTVSGIDFNFLWEPANRARYRNVEVRGEYIHTDFETEDLGKIRSDSFYAYLSFRLNRRWFVGLRYDDAEIPSDRFELFDPATLEELEFTEGLKERAWTPFVTWWQSEFVRLRLQYQHADRDYVAPWGEDDDRRVSLQVTFAAGPHKHESY